MDDLSNSCVAIKRRTKFKVEVSLQLFQEYFSKGIYDICFAVNICSANQKQIYFISYNDIHCYMLNEFVNDLEKLSLEQADVDDNDTNDVTKMVNNKGRDICRRLPAIIKGQIKARRIILEDIEFVGVYKLTGPKPPNDGLLESFKLK